MSSVHLGVSQVRVYRHTRADRSVYVERVWSDHHGDAGVRLPYRELQAAPEECGRVLSWVLGSFQR